MLGNAGNAMLGKQAGLGRAERFSGGKEGASLEPIHRRVAGQNRRRLILDTAERVPRGSQEELRTCVSLEVLLSAGIPLSQEKITYSRCP